MSQKTFSHTRTLDQIDPVAHQYLTRLRIISKIPENGQLDLTSNDINIYSPGFVNWVYRKVCGDGKMNTIGFLRTFYEELVAFTSHLMQSIMLDHVKSTKAKKYRILANIADKIKSSIGGLVNLGKTYRQYPKISSTIESIQQDIIEPQLASIMVFLPSDPGIPGGPSKPINIPSKYSLELETPLNSAEETE